MKRLTNNLLIVLAVQLLALAWVFWPNPPPGAADAEKPLLTVAGGQVDRLLISAADSKLEMRRDEDAWRMPDYHNLVVQDALVERLLAELPGMNRGFPIAGSSSAKQRFEVAEDNFQRRVQYFAGSEQLAQLFLGTSPGFRQIHVRPGQEEQVYSIEFNSYDLPINSTHWLDKTLLQLEAPSAISGVDYRIHHSEDQWLGEDGVAANETAVERLVNGLASLRVTGAADDDTASILEEMAAPPVLSVSAGDTAYDYHLYEIEAAYYVRRSDIPVYFALSKFDYDRLNDSNASTLFPPPDEGAATEPESAAVE
ncbi:MAG: DUF4340 domain-containing protein [Halieaceae bacterium]|nr:DUF4340 domain-containing protein [Halieaceae bacterium]